MVEYFFDVKSCGSRPQVSIKNRAIASKMPPRFAKKQGSMSIEQPEETLSTSSLGTEIWETNSTGESDLCVVCQVCHFQHISVFVIVILSICCLCF